MKKKKVLAIVLLMALAALTIAPVALAAEDGTENMITYISDMEWKAAEIYNNSLPSRDENVAGEELWLRDLYFEKGVCLHAMPGENAYIEIDIEGKGYKTFSAVAGTAESELYNVTMASVRFKFKVDGKNVLKTDVLTPKKTPETVTVDVTGARTFRIEMDDGGDGISGDWGALGNALFSTLDAKEDIEKAVKETPVKHGEEAPAEREDKPAAAGSKIELAGKSGCGSALPGAGAVAAAAIGVLACGSAKRKKKR